MRVGTVREIKAEEGRVGLTPGSVSELVSHGHEVVVETGAGRFIGADDAAYRSAGATIADDAAAVFGQADMIVKVKEPQEPERAMLEDRHTLFTYLHLAPDPDQARDLQRSKALCVAYETVTDDKGRLPLLTPMSKVAGRKAVRDAAHYLELNPETGFGRGIEFGGVPGSPGAKTVILGAGVSGWEAITYAAGMEADLTVLDTNLETLGEVEKIYPRARTLFSTKANIEESVLAADVVIGAVLIQGDLAPKLVTADMVRRMKSGAVIVDIAIDQGGCIETSVPTTHKNPTRIVDDVIHLAVANMPGAVAGTSTDALNNATLPYVVSLANHGTNVLRQPALAARGIGEGLRNGVNVIQGHFTHEGVVNGLNKIGFADASYVSLNDALGAA